MLPVVSYLLANPPYGVDWKAEQDEISKWSDYHGYKGKLPRVNDGALMFLLTMIGEVPAHWEVKRSKRVFTERDNRSETGDEELLTVSHITGVTKRSEKDVNMFEAETTEGYKRCSPGNLVINTLWAWMGAMGISPEEGIVSPAYHVYELSDEILPG